MPLDLGLVTQLREQQAEPAKLDTVNLKEVWYGG